MSSDGSLSAPFVRLSNGRWELQPDGVALLQRVPAPMVVVAVAGLYRTGKSFFLNALAGHVGERSRSGFRVGSTSESCTRGIDVCVPAGASSPAGSLVLLDTEGLASMEQDESYDAQVRPHEPTRPAPHGHAPPAFLTPLCHAGQPTPFPARVLML
jgi:hypothetical protein